MAGRQKFNEDYVGKITQDSNVQVSVGKSSVTLGGLQYDFNSRLINTGVSGVGGLDTGSVAVSLTYFIYAVISAGDAYLISSLSQNNPSGYTTYKKIGAFRTNDSGDINVVAGLQASGDPSFPPTRSVLSASSGTYTTPPGAKVLRVRMVGGGGGGGSTSGSGATGGTTTFGPDLSCSGGNPGTSGEAANGGTGGGHSIGANPKITGVGMTGGGGGAGIQPPGIPTAFGGAGGASAFGGNGSGRGLTAGGVSASANSGAGGSAQPNENNGSGGCSGGGSGAYVDVTITDPDASYAYTVGSGGGGASGAGNGGSGIIIVDEIY